MTLDVSSGEIAHRSVRDLPELLRGGDLIVANNSRVFPARLVGRLPTGARVELLLLQPRGSGTSGTWEALGKPGRKLRTGTTIDFPGLTARIVGRGAFGRRTVELTSESELFATLDRIGRTPLPPYIKRSGDSLEGSDRERYQTVYAREPGSIAAPTAGLHFSPELCERLLARGVGWAEVTLHVGYGTFQPVRTETVEEHVLEAESYTIPEATAEAIAATRAAGGRVIAVGTTTVRTLETAAVENRTVKPGSGSTSLFIHPGFRFRVVDALLTNFHLPRSSLFILVSAFGGLDLVRRAYEEAVRERYRFYSYGDAMLIFS